MSNFHFNISLSILNHLWRNLYRNFITVIWEAISNSWDADGKNVYIYIQDDSLIVLDSWEWMGTDDFQDKFLNIWYSKRKEFWATSKWERPFIGRKWIWKLALLSCAERIYILSKKKWNAIIWWIIDNSILEDKIKDNLKADDYPLEQIDEKIFLEHPIAKELDHGTMIIFEDLNDWIKNNLEVIRKLIVLNFRFSLIDKDFNIYVNDKIISLEDIKDLSENTQFLWKINNFEDEIYGTFKNLKENKNVELTWINIHWFIASVNKPSALNIYWVWEKTGIDLFVNGRLRENNILKNSKKWFSSRIIASYLYGQIHINDLDDEADDRFTSSREWVKPGDEKYGKYLDIFENKILAHIPWQWDSWRKKHKETWDVDNWTMPKFQALMHQSKDSREKDFETKLDEINIDEKIKESLKEKMRHQSSNNTAIYQDLFILENLFREYIKIKWITIEYLSTNIWSEAEIKLLLKKFHSTKNSRNEDEETHALKWKIIQNEDELNYIDFVHLGMLVDIANNSKGPWRYNPLTMEAHSKEILAIRNPIMHTNEVTEDAFNWEKIKNIIDFLEKMTTAEPE